MSGENKVSVRCVYLYVSFFLFYYGVLHGETKKKKRVVRCIGNSGGANRGIRRIALKK